VHKSFKKGFRAMISRRGQGRADEVSNLRLAELSRRVLVVQYEKEWGRCVWGARSV
jgi:hypothetical protein